MALNKRVHHFLTWLGLLEPEMIAWPPTPRPITGPEEPMNIEPKAQALPPATVERQRQVYSTISDQEWLRMTGQVKP